MLISFMNFSEKSWVIHRIRSLQSPSPFGMGVLQMKQFSPTIQKIIGKLPDACELVCCQPYPLCRWVMAPDPNLDKQLWMGGWYVSLYTEAILWCRIITPLLRVQAWSGPPIQPMTPYVICLLCCLLSNSNVQELSRYFLKHSTTC